MSFVDHFSVVDDAISPQPWMQLRAVGTDSTPSVTKSYDPSDGAGKNELIQTLQVDWTNNAPVQQWVYGMVTRGGSRVTLQTRSRAYLKSSHGLRIGAGAITLSEASRFGVGADVGVGGLLALGSAFSVAELRQNSGTMPFIPALTGMTLVQPGETIHARVEVRFVSDFWENSQITGGDTGTEAEFVAGEQRLDLFAVPSVVPPPPRLVPTIVGGISNVKWDRDVNLIVSGSQVNVPLPAGLATGDTLLAICCNQFGLSTDMYPLQDGWTQAHSRNDGLFGLGDVHMRVFVRQVGDPGDEPAHYNFKNNFPGTEETAVIIPLRGAAVFDGGNGSNWYVGSNLSRFKLVEDQVAPSIERAGQFLIAVSFFNHSPTQTITQTPPVGMTEVVDLPGEFSSLAVAMLASPPMPTFNRRFTPSETPIFFGHSIAASIVVPGAQVF